jgi:alpha-tubulin suppressor-like RCC1 family protein
MNTTQTLKIACLSGAALLQVVTCGAQPVTKVAAGDFHSLFLKSDGSLWAMGDNEYGQLGYGSYININQPEQIVASNVTAMAGGGILEPLIIGGGDLISGHSLFLKSDGSLWAMGWNEYGQLGDGTYTTNFPYGISVPQQIVASNITAMAAGGFHNLFLKSDGSLWAMGLENDGQLGDGTYGTYPTYSTNQPEQIMASNVTAIAAGGYHSLFLNRDGSLWAMGDNASGQLGDGTIDGGNFGTNLPEQIISSNVTAIAAGWFHSLFLKSDGSLWAMGDESYGELGDGTYGAPPYYGTNRPEEIVSSNVMAIAAGGFHSLFLKSDGSLWAMGDNGYGQLGDGTANYYTNLPEEIVASNVTAIAAGGYHSLFLKRDGSLWAMGANYYGQLGDDTYNNTNLPEEIVVGRPGFNQISIQLLSGGEVLLTFVGIAGTNYALDSTFSLSPANWVPLVTNPADAAGMLVFTNTPDPTTNNFWRIRSVP